MTDTPTPPERIWAWPENTASREGAYSSTGDCGTPYVREDLTGWRSMDSAPKDGTLFLACHHDPAFQNACVIYWDIGAPSLPIDGRWRTSMHEIVGDRFTHWMPLPTLPEARP